MELSFSELRAKEVVNTQDGRKLGKVCDIALCYPENKWIGIVVPNKRGFAAKRNDLFIEMRNIVKIGEDVILVNVGLPRGDNGRDNCGKRDHGPNVPPPHRDQRGFSGCAQNRNYEEFE